MTISLMCFVVFLIIKIGLCLHFIYVTSYTRDLRKHNMRNGDKEKYVTGAYKDVPSTNFPYVLLITVRQQTRELRVCRRYAFDVYANRTTLFCATGLNHGLVR